MVNQRLEKIKRSARREIDKKIAEERLLQRKVGKKVKTVMEKFPDIGQEMEAFVKQCGIGAGRLEKDRGFDI